MKEIFEGERERVISVLKKKKEDAALVFGVVTDSHLDDFEQDTLENIRAVDAAVEFECLVHLGDFLNGSFPKRYTRRLLQEEMAKYKACIQNGVFYPVQGNHDGYWDAAVNYDNVALDEEWYAATKFVEEYECVSRRKKKPYYYVDVPKQRVRLVILCSFSYEWTAEGYYRKLYQPDEEQLLWLRREALNLSGDWTVMLFSHDGPLQFYEEKMLEQELWKGRSRELFEAVLKSRREHGFFIAAWFVGHWHGELCQAVCGIPFVLVGCQTCYVPQLWDMPKCGHYEKRERGTLSQELWDGVVLDMQKRELYLCRFGAGNDRVLKLNDMIQKEKRTYCADVEVEYEQSMCCEEIEAEEGKRTYCEEMEAEYEQSMCCEEIEAEEEKGTCCMDVEVVAGEYPYCMRKERTGVIDAAVKNRLLALKEKGAFVFAAVAGGQMSECSDAAAEALRRWDEELVKYRDAIGSRQVFVTQGERDGYRDESYVGQLVCGIMTNRDWSAVLSCMDAQGKAIREAEQPYYYVDVPKQRLRLIFMCSSFYQHDVEERLYERFSGFDMEQLKWLKNKALQAEAGWRILLFSHAMPKSRFDTGKEPFVYQGFATEKLLNILQSVEKANGISVAAWFGGHYGYYEELETAGLCHISLEDTTKQPCLYGIALGERNRVEVVKLI